MWDWYNRPGGMSRLSTRTTILIVLGAGIVMGLLTLLLLVLLAPFIFAPLPVR